VVRVDVRVSHLRAGHLVVEIRDVDAHVAWPDVEAPRTVVSGVRSRGTVDALPIELGGRVQ
jgi:hypothetical protein